MSLALVLRLPFAISATTLEARRARANVTSDLLLGGFKKERRRSE